MNLAAMTTPTVDSIVELYRREGARQYGGEAVNQLQHALQCAHLAERADAAPELVAACLLHDIGHMIGRRPDWNLAGRAVEFFAVGASHEYQHTQTEQAALLEHKTVNDLHEHRAQWYLGGLFGAGVLEPIRLHVEAKRYLCRAEPAYWDTLSMESKRSLEVQGGRYSGEQALAFIALPHARGAVRLRRWDDQAKMPWAVTPDLDHYQAVLKSVAL